MEERIGWRPVYAVASVRSGEAEAEAHPLTPA